MESRLKKCMTVLKMTRFPIYMLISMATGILYAQVIMSEKVMMIAMSPVYVIFMYYILWFQYSNYNIVHKDVFNIVPLTKKSRLKCYNFAIISNVVVQAAIITTILAVDYNPMCYCIVPDFVIIISAFYGSTKLKMDDTGRDVFYILIGLATSIIFILEGGVML